MYIIWPKVRNSFAEYMQTLGLRIFSNFEIDSTEMDYKTCARFGTYKNTNK